MSDATNNDDDRTTSLDGPRTRPLRWYLASMAGVFAIIAVAILLTLQFSPKFTASALISIEDRAPYIARRPSGDDEISDKRFVQTQVEIIRSPLVLGELLTQPQIAAFKDVITAQDRVALLRSNLSVKRVGDSDLFNISYTSPSPEHAASVANAVVMEYLRIQGTSDYERAQRVIQLLDNERSNRRLLVETLRNKVLKLTKDTGVDPFGSDASLKVPAGNSRKENLSQRLLDLEIKCAILQAKIEGWAEALPQASDDAGDVENADAAASPPQPSRLAELKGELEEIEVEREVVAKLLQRELETLETDSRMVVDLSFAREELARETEVLDAIEDRRIALQTESNAPPRVTVRQKAAIPAEPRSWRDGPERRSAIAAGWLSIAAVVLLTVAILVRPRR